MADKEINKAANTPLPSVSPDRFQGLSQFTDRFGHPFYYGDAGDYRHPPFPIEPCKDYKSFARKVEEFEIRPDDVLLFSYPKTGTHWHYEMMKMLLKKNAEHTENQELMSSFIDYSAIEQVGQMPSPRVLVSHVPCRHLPKQVFEKKIKIVFVERNPKDTMVSFYNQVHKHPRPVHYPGTFEQFFYLCMESGFYYGPLFDYLMEWQQLREARPEFQVQTSSFEDMKADPVTGVKKLNQYLITGCSDQLCEDIANACSFKTLKAVQDEKSLKNKNSPTQKSVSPYRKGQVGDWQNWFTETMNETYEAEYTKRMAGYTFQYKYTL